MFLSSRRRLLQALIISVLVHAVFLITVVALTPVRLDSPATTVITAVINHESRAIVTKPESLSIARPVEEAKKPDFPVTPKASERELAVRDPSPFSVPASPLGSISQPPVRETVSPDVTSSGTRATGESAPASTAAPVREGASADDLRQYHTALILAAKRLSSERYPKLAKERGWEGDVSVEVRVNVSLPEPEVALVESSGHRVLDDFAVDLMKKAARRTAIPDGLKGKNFPDLIEWKFNLKDDQ